MAMTLKSQGALHGVVHDSGLAVGAMNSFNKSVLRCRYLWGRTKLSVSKALILPVLLYGSERRTLFCALKSRLDAFCNRSLRRIVRVHLEGASVQPKGTGAGRHRQLRPNGHRARFPTNDPAHQVTS